MSPRRVAVTGLGVVAPLGNSVDELLASLLAGISGVSRLPAPLGTGLRSPIAAAVKFDGAAFFPAPRLRMLDRVSQFALVAAAAAVADARLDFGAQDRERCGVCIGTSIGGAHTTEEGYHTLYAERSDRIQPYSVLGAMNNAAAAWIGIEYGLQGANLTHSTACSSSAVAIGEAARRIQHGDADIMIAGGTEAPLVPGVLRAWEAMRSLATGLGACLRAGCRDPRRIVRLWPHQRGGPHHASVGRRTGARHAGGVDLCSAATRGLGLYQCPRHRHVAE